MKRSTLLNIHKILGLVTGLVVFIVSITGCLWAFKEEIESLYSDYKIVTPQEQTIITASQAKVIAEKALPGRHIHGALFGGPTDAVEVIFYEPDPVFYHSVFINPYSGDVLKTVDHRAGFFGIVLHGHIALWLPPEIGTHIVSFSVLFFLFILITGILLWWPKNKQLIQHKLKLHWNERTKWKKKNYDLHSIVGFYVSLFAFVIASTGCVMAFNWFYYIVFLAAGGSHAPQFIIPNHEVQNVQMVENLAPLDRAIPLLREKYPNGKSFELHYPETDSTSIYVEITNTEGLHYDADFVFLDQYTLENIPTGSIYNHYKDADFADKVIRMNYDIHIGSIGGIVGKIIAFLISLFTALLPVTGCMIWWNKYKKKRSKSNRPQTSKKKAAELVQNKI